MLSQSPSFDCVFASKSRALLVYLLATNGEVNISELVRLSKANHANVSKHLEALTQMEVIEEIRFGTRIRVYRINKKTKQGLALQSMIDLWNKEVRSLAI